MTQNKKYSLRGFSSERLVLESEKRNTLIQEHVSRYEYVTKYISGKKILDIACGSGYGSALLINHGALRVTGIDISEEALRYAKDHYRYKGLEYLQGNAENIKIDGPIDTVVSFETIEHLQNPDLFLKEIARLLAKDGQFIASTPVRSLGTIKTQPANPHHLREWSEEEFKELLGQYFRKIQIGGQYWFKKKWYPYSRRIQQMFFKMRYPEDALTINRLPVIFEPPSYNGFAFSMAYIIAICSNKR
jgi:ubiquinone/menaquinone biosynthesis C-methylase UbiE